MMRRTCSRNPGRSSPNGLGSTGSSTRTTQWLLSDRTRPCLGSVSRVPVRLAEHLESLKSQCDSQLERTWLDYLATRGLRLPTTAQKHFPQCGTRPDFVYDKEHTAIYVDGPPHDFIDRQKRDAEATDRMEELGLTVLRFHHQDDWSDIIAQFPNLFGVPQN